MRTAYIYALMHPTTKEVFYIGKTVDISIRMAEHKGMAAYHFKELELKADYEVIDECDDRLAYFVEKRWIRHYLNKGANLCNAPSTYKGYKHSDGTITDFKTIGLFLDEWINLANLSISNGIDHYKDFVEEQLRLMGDKGLSYLDLYTQLERTTQLLRELQGEEKLESELPI